MKYAQNTEVSADRSRAEIEKTLQRYGAQGFGYGWQDSQAMIEFLFNRKKVRFVLQMPDRNSDEFKLTPGQKRERSDAQAFAAWEQATRQRWRALALAVKAKLEVVEAGIATFEAEFLAHIVMPDGKTVAEHALPEIEKAYLNGQMPRLLLGPMQA